MTSDEYELFLIALGVEEEADIDYLSFVFLPTFSSPFYASIQLCSPCRVKLHIPIDEWDDEDLDSFEHYWEAEGYPSSGLSKHTLRDFYQLNSADFIDYCDFNSRDGFAAYCKGVFEGESFCFFTQNPELKTEKTHCQYLMLIRKVLLKVFPNVAAVKTMRSYLSFL